MEKTLGEKRVRTDFNVSGSGDVDVIKNATAGLINTIDRLKSYHATGAGVTTSPANDPEQLRLISLAQTAYEEAAMWAVKAITFSK